MRRLIPLTALVISFSVPAVGAENVKPIDQRFAASNAKEVPDFRRHMSPLMGKLGCNGRACHGSFQGRGGFRLSLFGHDFDMDHKSITEGEEPRVDLKNPNESLIIQKPTNPDYHEGGLRYKIDNWEHHVFRRWIEGGAKNIEKDAAEFVRLEVTPGEIVFRGKDEKVQLQAVAVWSDGTREDVTPLCRFQSNSSVNAEITESGLITSGEAGDTHVVVFYDKGVVPVPVIQPVSALTGSKYPKVKTPTKIDELVVQKLKKLGIVPSDPANDVEFLRRVRLDLTGSLPTPSEIKIFLADPSPDKRSRKIDELLETPAYAAWWTTKLCDITGNNDDKLNNVVPGRVRPASQDWYDWIHKRVSENTPYDELAAGIVVANSRNEGEGFEEFAKTMSRLYREDAKEPYAENRETMPYYWARNNFRQPEERVIGFAYTFLGIRIQCAQCHKHPFDQWTQDDFNQFKPFFTSTRFGTNPESRDEYGEMLAKLDLGNLRGGQQRRAIGEALQDGKDVPFQEVYTTRPRGGNNNSNRNSRRIAQTINRLNEQIKQAKEEIEQFKKDGKTEQAQSRQRDLRRLQGQLNRVRRQQRGQNNNSSTTARVLGGEDIDLSKFDDPRKPLMQWLRDKNNQYFAKAFVNRVWASYFSVGIVDPPDDMSLANPPSNRPLLDYLTQGFIDSGFDMKWLHREIANSRTYQLSWVPNETNRQDEINFSHAIPRRLPAEVAYDAIQQATATDEEIEEMHQDISGRAIAIPGAGRRNRRSRDAAYALTVFGRSIRESNCDCDRSSEASLLQTVFLQNDEAVLEMIDRRSDGWLDEVARELGVPLASNDRNSRQARARAQQARARAGQLAEVNKRIGALQAGIRRAKKAGNARQLKSLQAQLAGLKKRAEALSPNDGKQPAGKENAKDLLADKAEEIINEAYLRTLSRYPQKEELQRSRKYLTESEDAANGVRGLLWALLNTKEFIVNH